MPPFSPGKLAAALAGIMLTSTVPAFAADSSQAELLKELHRLSERLEKLEAHNAALEKKLQTPPAEPEAELAQRVKALEENNAKLEAALEDDRLSENQPEMATRLKAVEMQALNMQKPARTVEALDGVTAGVSLTTVAQRAGGAPSGTDIASSQLNYRGDISVSLPMPKIGDTDSKIFAQFRIGQGNGLNALPSVFAKPNASAFRASGGNPDDSVAILGQAWYQATIPLPFGGFKPRSRESMEINFGKMDPFAFFDQNAAANDETRQFLNTVFVHNALLDAGGDIGVDANGFSPGVRVSYLNEKEKLEKWRLSLGVFGAGRGANYTKFFGSPLVIAQAETQQKFFGGLTGNYRLYAWNNGQGPDYDGAASSHSGWGANFDQRIGDSITAFGRYGQGSKGKLRFDRAVSLGAELSGSDWSRGGDAIGLAFGAQRISANFRNDSTTLDANGDGTPDFGYTAQGWEKISELYYRYRINKQFELSPDFQLIQNPAGNGAASSVKILGLRAQLMY
ncbi:carbohydrate porin [Sulfuricella sp.]|uniref:carbohydrate porin n=1 Tax=Sulfuricella sp. TaxID=2099377 RepID=UPI002C28DF88|nr:carbohydrate porin [Sulfuricella sp.]HUX63679.1 carbohydrate porin [Sulfuricella sp.]